MNHYDALNFYVNSIKLRNKRYSHNIKALCAENNKRPIYLDLYECRVKTRSTGNKILNILEI